MDEHFGFTAWDVEAPLLYAIAVPSDLSSKPWDITAREPPSGEPSRLLLWLFCLPLLLQLLLGRCHGGVPQLPAGIVALGVLCLLVSLHSLCNLHEQFRVAQGPMHDAKDPLPRGCVLAMDDSLCLCN